MLVAVQRLPVEVESEHVTSDRSVETSASWLNVLRGAVSLAGFAVLNVIGRNLGKPLLIAGCLLNFVCVESVACTLAPQGSPDGEDVSSNATLDSSNCTLLRPSG